MEEAILKKVEELAPQLIDSIIELVQIDSTEGQPEEGAPFGKGVAKALDKALEIAGGMGFETVNMDHHIGYAKYGSGDDYICAIGHVVVDPAGTGW